MIRTFWLSLCLLLIVRCAAQASPVLYDITVTTIQDVTHNGDGYSIVTNLAGGHELFDTLPFPSGCPLACRTVTFSNNLCANCLSNHVTYHCPCPSLCPIIVHETALICFPACNPVTIVFHDGADFGTVPACFCPTTFCCIGQPHFQKSCVLIGCPTVVCVACPPLQITLAPGASSGCIQAALIETFFDTGTPPTKNSLSGGFVVSFQPLSTAAPEVDPRYGGTAVAALLATILLLADRDRLARA